MTDPRMTVRVIGSTWSSHDAEALDRLAADAEAHGMTVTRGPEVEGRQRIHVTVDRAGTFVPPLPGFVALKGDVPDWPAREAFERLIDGAPISGDWVAPRPRLDLCAIVTPYLRPLPVHYQVGSDAARVHFATVREWFSAYPISAR